MVSEDVFEDVIRPFAFPLRYEMSLKYLSLPLDCLRKENYSSCMLITHKLDSQQAGQKNPLLLFGQTHSFEDLLAELSAAGSKGQSVSAVKELEREIIFTCRFIVLV